MSGPPVDLSFKNISNVAGALSEVPNSGLLPVRTNSERKYLSCCLRLNNNSITDLVGFQFMLPFLLAEPSKLGWLDLSFNKLTIIDSVLCELKELQVLYLHGNSIWNLADTDKLGQLKRLHTITLHGNPIDSTKNYRPHLIRMLPQLKKLDFSAVTPNEKALAKFWCPCSKPAIKAKKDEKSAVD